MNKNTIFLGALAAALVLAAISSRFSDENGDGHGFSIQYDSDDENGGDNWRSDGSDNSIEFNGERYKCDPETGKVELTHDDGSVTMVTCT